MNMDAELTSLLTQVDGLINNLPLNPNVPIDRIRDMQSRRAELDKQLADYRSDNERRYASFKSSLLSRIRDLQNRVEDLQRTDR